MFSNGMCRLLSFIYKAFKTDIGAMPLWCEKIVLI